jgi:uncharacterized protein (TIGR03083 family)
VERVVEAFHLAGEVTAAVVASPEVASAWSAPSALPDYRVGELAAHILLATARLELVLVESPASAERTVVDVPAFYGMNRVEDPSDTGAGHHALIRAAAADTAERGPEPVADELRGTLDRVRPALATADPARPLPVLNVRHGATSLRDYLRTRVLELTVHGDDLAASVGLSYDVPPAAADVTLGVCLELARARSGDLAVMRAFTRRERADADVLRVL